MDRDIDTGRITQSRAGRTATDRVMLGTRDSDLFIARQPIFDRARRLAAYELLYRGAPGSGAVDDARATAAVMQRAFDRIGIATALGPARGFVNVDAEMLFDARVDRLPKQQVVLELLETVDIDARVVRRCEQLKARGFRLALDDVFRYEGRYEPLLAIADIVKIDLLLAEREGLEELVRRLRLYPVRLLAEKVETREQIRRCMRLGFDLFQGFLLARPSLLAG